jgi:hypothetical protein
VYLTEKTNVKFRPFGLDLFDKLVQACKSVRTQLESDQRALGTDRLATVRDSPRSSRGSRASFAACSPASGVTSRPVDRSNGSAAQTMPEPETLSVAALTPPVSACV